MKGLATLGTLAVWMVFADRPAWGQFGSPGGDRGGYGNRGGYGDRNSDDGDRGRGDFGRGGFGGGYSGGYGGGFSGRPSWGSSSGGFSGRPSWGSSSGGFSGRPSWGSSSGGFSGRPSWGDREGGRESDREGGREGDAPEFGPDGDRRDGEDKKVEKSRVTVDLPEAFTAGDGDGDGQIGLYEWRQWKPTEFRLFALYDANRDGFLTPRELVIATEFPPTDSLIDELLGESPSEARPGTGPASRSYPGSNPLADTPPTQPTSTQSPRYSRDLDGNISGSPAAGSGSKPSEAEARYVFGVLDKDRDGTLTEAEWTASEDTRQGFADTGARLTLPATLDSFLRDYPHERMFPQMPLR